VKGPASFVEDDSGPQRIDQNLVVPLLGEFQGFACRGQGVGKAMGLGVRGGKRIEYDRLPAA
jgi:hypothetical protein